MVGSERIAYPGQFAHRLRRALKIAARAQQHPIAAADQGDQLPVMPSAINRPWSMMPMRSQKRSASSM